MADENKSVAPATPTPPPLSPPSKVGQPATLPASHHAVAAKTGDVVTKHGGARGGRQREDGLVPGSPEAIEADKKKDRDRKAGARKVAERIMQPAPLPPASGGGKIIPVAFDPNAGAPPLAPVEVPWTAKDLDPVTILGMDVWEESRVSKVEKCLMEANLPPKTINELSADARFPTPAKKAVVDGSGAALAEGLNAIGVPSKYKHMLSVSTGFALILKHNAKMDRRMEELIAAAKGTQPGQPKK